MPSHLRAPSAFALLVALLPGQQQVLRLQLPPDTTLRCVATVELDTNMLQPRKLDSAVRVELHFDLRLGADAGDGYRAAALTVRRLRIRIDTGDAALAHTDYDSDAEHGDAGLLRDMTVLVGKSIALQLDERGRFRKAELPPGFPAAAVAAFGGDLARFFGDLFPELPPDPVAVDATWQTATAMALQPQGSVPFRIDNRLQEVRQQRARVQQQLQVDTKDLQQDGRAVRIDKAVGSYELDLQTGMLVSATTELEVHQQGILHGLAHELNTRLLRTLKVQPPEAGKPK